MPSRSMNAPKSVMFFTTPLRIWPGWIESSRLRRFCVRCSSMSSRRESTTFWRSRLNLEDLEVVGLAHVLIEVLGGLHVDVRGRHERIDADAHDQAALDLGLHAAGRNGTLRKLGEDVVPVFLLLGWSNEMTGLPFLSPASAA